MILEQTLQQVQKTKFWQDKKILFLTSIGLAVNILTWALIIIIFWGIDRPVALHANILFGIDSIGHWHQLLILPLLGLAILIINFTLAFSFYILRQKYLINLLIRGLVFVQVVLFVSVLIIISL